MLRGYSFYAAPVLIVGVVAIVTGTDRWRYLTPVLVLFALAAWLALGGVLARPVAARAEARGLQGERWRSAWLVTWIVLPVLGPLVVLAVLAASARDRHPSRL